MKYSEKWCLKDGWDQRGAAVGVGGGALHTLLKLLNFDFQILWKYFLSECKEQKDQKYALRTELWSQYGTWSVEEICSRHRGPLGAICNGLLKKWWSPGRA